VKRSDDALRTLRPTPTENEGFGQLPARTEDEWARVIGAPDAPPPLAPPLHLDAVGQQLDATVGLELFNGEPITRRMDLGVLHARHLLSVSRYARICLCRRRLKVAILMGTAPVLSATINAIRKATVANKMMRRITSPPFPTVAYASKGSLATLLTMFWPSVLFAQVPRRETQLSTLLRASIHPTSWKGNSPNFVFTILHSPGPNRAESRRLFRWRNNRPGTLLRRWIDMRVTASRAHGNVCQHAHSLKRRSRSVQSGLSCRRLALASGPGPSVVLSCLNAPFTC
jgi:hypothetical protein